MERRIANQTSLLTELTNTILLKLFLISKITAKNLFEQHMLKNLVVLYYYTPSLYMIKSNEYVFRVGKDISMLFLRNIFMELEFKNGPSELYDPYVDDPYIYDGPFRDYTINSFGVRCQTFIYSKTPSNKKIIKKIIKVMKPNYLCGRSSNKNYNILIIHIQNVEEDSLVELQYGSCKKYKSDGKHYFLTSIGPPRICKAQNKKTFPIELCNLNTSNNVKELFSNSPTWCEEFSHFNKELKTLDEVYKEAESYL